MQNTDIANIVSLTKELSPLPTTVCFSLSELRINQDTWNTLKLTEI